MNPLNISVTLSVSVDDLIEQMIERGDREELEGFIATLDLEVADAGFTEGLITRLCKSLRSDYSPDEWDAFTKELANL
jgi:hypothetical protein